MRHNPLTQHLAVLALCGLAAGASAQADFTEAFENNGPVQNGQWGPQNLIDQGWIFRNQSDPANEAAWYDGDGIGGLPLEGEGYLQTDSMATDFLGGRMSVWAILPPIPGQQAGDAVSLWIAGGNSASDTYFELRYSPTGATGTGSDHDDFGDFTDLLYSAELPISQNGYRQIVESLPGDGRIAFRFRAPWIMTAFGRGTSFSVDSLAVGGDAGDPCSIPMPQPGETVVWTLADSPYTVCSQMLLIPAGGEVVVEPGVTITFEPDCRLRVEGAITAHGTPDAPIVFNGDHEPGSGIEVTGSADLSFVELGTDLGNPGHEATLILRDSVINAGVEVWGGPDVAVIERCEFRGGVLGAIAGSLRITDTDFSQGGHANLHGLLYMDNVSIDGAPLLIAGESIAAPNYLDTVSVTNYTAGAGVSVYGNNFQLGPNFVTQGNRYPFEFDILGAGLLKGSKLPTTGNIFNYIAAHGLVLGAPNRYWADTGIPYVVDGFPDNFGGWLTIEPGTTLRFEPGAGAFMVQNADLIAEGTPDKPITFEAADPGQPWFGLKWVDNAIGRQRDVIYDRAEFAIQSDGSDLLLQQCEVTNSGIGAATQTSGIVRLRGSRFLDNGIGLSTTTTGRIDADGAIGPNTFAGNTLAVEYNNTDGDVPAFEHNWWDSPTGPTTVQNPGGTGDPVEGLLAPWFTPFRSSAPGYDDPPRIDLEPIYYMVHSRDKIILRWDATDDSAIASQRVEFADHAAPTNYYTIANLGPDDRSFEFTAPVVEPTNQYTIPSGIRIVAVDDAGQEWYDEAIIRIPYQEDFTPVHQEVQDVAGLVRPHDWVDVCWLPGGTSTVYTAIDDVILTKYHGGAGNCLPNGAIMPFVSTDRARFLVFTTYGAGGRLGYAFSDYFSIRPQELYGDAPPEVTLTSPAGGEAFRGGGTIPVRWNASDDESVRSIAIQATYDAGISWHAVEDELDPALTSFDWVLPASTGIDEVRVRVVATDLRFQNSSSTSAAFQILPGEPGDCPADFNADGAVNTLDVLAFLNAWSAGDPAADFNADGQINTLDVLAFLNAWSAGC